ncbi:MAG: MFS transporter [Saprospiraceae bacterium]|nr:MFS transporter [Saprospiraceae bacterium]
MNERERLILILLAALNFTHILDFMIMMPLGNYLMPFFGLNASQFTTLVSVYAFGAGISSFIAAFAVNHFDRKKVLVGAYAGFLLGTLACGLATSYALLLTARTIAGLFGGLIGAQVISIVADLISYERRGKAMGMVMAAFSVASTLGVPFALYLANAISWHAPFILVAAVGSFILPMLIKYIPKMDSHIVQEDTTSAFHVFSSVIQDKKQMAALLFSGLMFMGHFLIIPFINPFLELNMGFHRQVTPLVYLCGGISSFFAANIIGSLSDKYGKWNTYVVCLFLSLPLVVFITHMPQIHMAFVLFVFALWFTIATGRGVSAQAMISNVVDPRYRGSFQSFNSFMQQVGTGAASVIAGLIVVRTSSGKLDHYRDLGFFSIFILLLTLLAGYFAFKKPVPAP